MAAVSARERLWDLLEVRRDGSDRRIVLDWYDILLSTLIVLNIMAVILESVKGISDAYETLFLTFEMFSVALFTMEYIARIWACTADHRYSHPLFGRLKYAGTFMALVDLAAFLPFYIPAVLPVDLRFMRVLRLFRLLRVLKLGRYSTSLALLGRVLKAKAADLFAAIFGLLVILVLASSVMYFVEREAQPALFSSIPAAMWWAVATLTTIGYGDIYPVTELGRFVGSLIAVLGIGVFALPAGILASGFYEARQPSPGAKKSAVCPHCGEPLEGATPRPDKTGDH